MLRIMLHVSADPEQPIGLRYDGLHDDVISKLQEALADVSCALEMRYFISANGMRTIRAQILGETRQDAQKAAEFILEALAGGKEAFIRAEPESDTQTDFETNRVLHKGYVRFSYFERPGTWHRKRYIGENPLALGFGAPVGDG